MLKTFTLAAVKWIDACMQGDADNSMDVPNGVMMLSAGVLVRETADFISVANDWYPEQGNYRFIATIPKVNVVSIRKFKMEVKTNV